MERVPVQCPDCEVYHSNGQNHICTVYDGPECQTEGCNEPTVFVFIAAPGTGSGYSCKAGHYNGTNRELTIADVI